MAKYINIFNYLFIILILGETSYRIGGQFPSRVIFEGPTSTDYVESQSSSSGIYIQSVASTPVRFSETGESVSNGGRVLFAGASNSRPYDSNNIISDTTEPFFRPANADYNYAYQDSNNIKQVLSQIVDAIENMDLRLRKIEEVLRRVNLLGVATPMFYGNINGQKKCDDGQFTNVEGSCIYVSFWGRERAHWKRAEEICESRGANLISILTHAEFSYLSKFLAESEDTKGFNFWIGGVNIGLDFMWLANGQSVTLDRYYWESNIGQKTPGDISDGQCLSFFYTFGTPAYIFKGDDCGKEKYFLCKKT